MTLVLTQLVASCGHVKLVSLADFEKKRELNSIDLDVEHTETKTEDMLSDDQDINSDDLEAVSLNEEVPSPSIVNKFNPLRLFQKSSSLGESPLKSLGDKVPLNLTYLDEHYDFWVKYFTERGKDRFERQLNQGEAYRDITAKVFREYGLPEDLFYVGLIESGYSMHIKSHASAVGPWQFIKGTATRYGMRVNSQLDERTNIHKASVAAAGYFRDLYNIFGSWELALSAYNAGEYRIINAIRKGNTRDYRELVRKKLIPKETIYYVPKVAAARYLSENRKKYNIKATPVKDSFYINAAETVVQGTFSLREVSQKLNIPLADLTRLNPDFKNEHITAPRSGQRIIVPFHKLAEAKDLTFKSRRTVANSRDADSDVTGTYRVRRGDNLSRIAARHKTSVAQLRSLNSIRGSRILVGQTLRVPASQTRSYTVRRGDNLTRIAQRFKTTVPKIVEINSLRGTRIFPNQKIEIPSDS